jgi:hypothetical protein
MILLRAGITGMYHHTQLYFQFCYWCIKCNWLYILIL